MATKNTPATQSGIVVSTAIIAGPTPKSIRIVDLQSGMEPNHAEGIVVSTNLKAGPTPQSIRTIVLRG